MPTNLNIFLLLNFPLQIWNKLVIVVIITLSIYVYLFLQQVMLVPCGVTLQSCFILLWSTEMELVHPSKIHAWMIQCFITCTQMNNLPSLTFFFLSFFFPRPSQKTHIHNPKAIHFLISAIFVSGLWLVMVPLWKYLPVFPRGFTYLERNMQLWCYLLNMAKYSPKGEVCLVFFPLNITHTPSYLPTPSAGLLHRSAFSDEKCERNAEMWKECWNVKRMLSLWVNWLSDSVTPFASCGFGRGTAPRNRGRRAELWFSG